jgi:hypothetical protein
MVGARCPGSVLLGPPAAPRCPPRCHDVAVPLGLTADTPLDPAREGAERVAAGLAVLGRAPTEWPVADPLEIGWSAGEGAEVRGPI